MDVDNTATDSVDSVRMRSASRPLAVGLLALIYAAIVSALALALAARDIALVGTLDKYLGDFRYKTDSLDSVFATNQPAK